MQFGRHKLLCFSSSRGSPQRCNVSEAQEQSDVELPPVDFLLGADGVPSSSRRDRKGQMLMQSAEDLALVCFCVFGMLWM